MARREVELNLRAMCPDGVPPVSNRILTVRDSEVKSLRLCDCRESTGRTTTSRLGVVGGVSPWAHEWVGRRTVYRQQDWVSVAGLFTASDDPKVRRHRAKAPNSVANELSTLFARAWQRNPLLIMSLDYLGQFAAQLCFVDIRVEQEHLHELRAGAAVCLPLVMNADHFRRADYESGCRCQSRGHIRFPRLIFEENV